jgi:hypothetical protein
MKTFIRTAEIWVLPKDRTRLEFGGGLYGPLDAFGTGSETLRFGFGEGLPSKAWAAAIRSFLRISPLQDSSALRPRRQPGLTCAAALPVFAGEFLMAGGGVFSAATTTRMWVLSTSGITAPAPREPCAPTRFNVALYALLRFKMVLAGNPGAIDAPNKTHQKPLSCRVMLKSYPPSTGQQWLHLVFDSKMALARSRVR